MKTRSLFFIFSVFKPLLLGPPALALDTDVPAVEQLCDQDQDTSVERVGSLLLESFEEVFGVSAVPSGLVPPPPPPPPSEETPH